MKLRPRSGARNASSAARSELLDAAAALLGVESYARRVLIELEASPAPGEACPARAALRTIASAARSARADITTVDPTRPRGEPA